MLAAQTHETAIVSIIRKLPQKHMVRISKDTLDLANCKKLLFQAGVRRDGTVLNRGQHTADCAQ